MIVKLFSEITHVIKKYDHTCNNTCKASHWLAQLPSIILALLCLLIGTKMMSAFAYTNFTFETDHAFNFETNDKVQINGNVRHNTTTTWIIRLPEMFMVVWIRYFPATYLESLLTSMLSSSQWKIFTSSKKALEDSMTLTVNKCVKLKSKLQLKCFIFLKICHLLGCVIQRINCIDQSKWPLNTTADCGDFSTHSQWRIDSLNDVVQWNI